MPRRPGPTSPPSPRSSAARRAARPVLTGAGVLAIILVLVAAIGRVTPQAATGPRSTEPPGHAAQLVNRAPVAVEVSLAPRASTPIPRSFLGISTEYWTLPLFDGDRALFERVLSLLRVRGGGPLVLRIGGDSADHSFWIPPDPTADRAPRWVYALNSGWVRRAAAFVRQFGARLILDLNLITDTPAEAATWARAAVAHFPRGSILGFEIGNEPDLYARRYWAMALEHRWLDSPSTPLDLTAAGYSRAFRAYSSVLAEAAPGVPLIGPALGHPTLNADWIASLLATPHPGLRAVSGHWYPYSACTPRSSASYPTLSRILGMRAISRVVRDLEPVVRMAHRAGLRFRLTEINSVTCGGVRGVSNTFATALWAPDALFALARAGVDAVDVHVRPHAINAAFAIAGGRLHARPLLYGLALFTRCLGPGARMVGLRVHAPASARLHVWGVVVRRSLLHVLLIDSGPRSAEVRLRVAASRAASIQRLLAPGPAATSSVSLDGQSLSSRGVWRGRRITELARRTRGGFELSVPRYSAALVSVPLLPSPRHGARLAGSVHSRRGERRRVRG